MIVHTDEANEKLCPMGINRITQYADPTRDRFCVGSQCMVWVWQSEDGADGMGACGMVVPASPAAERS